MTHTATRCRGPIDRRSFLKIGGLSLGALSSGLSPDLAGLLAAEAAGAAAAVESGDISMAIETVQASRCTFKLQRWVMKRQLAKPALPHGRQWRGYWPHNPCNARATRQRSAGWQNPAAVHNPQARK